MRRERFPRHRLQWKLLVSDPGMHHGTCYGVGNVPGIPGACATRNFTYLGRGPWFSDKRQLMICIISRLPYLDEVTAVWRDAFLYTTLLPLLCILGFDNAWFVPQIIQTRREQIMVTDQGLYSTKPQDMIPKKTPHVSTLWDLREVGLVSYTLSDMSM